MDVLGVPELCWELRLTSDMYKLLKKADAIQRTLDVSKANNIDRRVHSIEDVKIIKVPSARFKTAYNFTDGCVADETAKQINIMLCHPSCQVSRQKYSYINVFTPGHDSRTADKYLYQNRKFWDSFMIENKACGMEFNVEA